MSNRLSTTLSVTALVVAVLGWTPLGEAAREAAFPPNSIGMTQLKTNAVTSPKIRNGSVQAIDVQKKSLTAAHIKPGSLLASSFKAGQLPAGPKGDKGDKGDRGEPAITNVLTRRTSGPTQALTSSYQTLLSLQLPRGKHLLLGKVWVSGSEPNFTAICTTGAGSANDVGIAAAYGGPAGASESSTTSMHIVLDLAAPATATLRCLTPRSGSWGEATLTALQIG